GVGENDAPVKLVAIRVVPPGLARRHRRASEVDERICPLTFRLSKAYTLNSHSVHVRLAFVQGLKGIAVPVVATLQVVHHGGTNHPIFAHAEVVPAALLADRT